MPEQIWYLKQCPLFEQLSRRDIVKLESVAKAREFSRGDPIYLPADEANSVFLLASGRAKICHLTAEGKQSILAFIEPGELFGELAILQVGEPRDEYAEAIERSMVVMIPADAIQQLIERHAKLSIGVTKLFGLRRKRVEQRLKNLLFLSNRERLSHLLLELAEKYGAASSEGIRLSIPLSHQDLANVIGSTRETVTMVLGDLQDAGLISVGRRQIIIKDNERLAESVKRPARPIPATTT